MTAPTGTGPAARRTPARPGPAPAAVLCGLGSWLPPTEVANDEIAGRLGVTDDWIHQRTGVRSRHRAAPGSATADMAVEAGARALKSQAAEGETPPVDAVLLATATPDRLCPSTAPAVAARLGLRGAAALDLSAACSGFVYALSVAAGLIAARTCARILVIGSDTMSAVLDPDDRGTAPIFGDGAGAAVLRAGDPEEPGALGPFVLGSDGAGPLADLIHIPAGGSLTRYGYSGAHPSAHLRMDGREVFKRAMEHMGAAVTAAAARTGWDLAGVDRFAIHQANARISRALATRLGVPEDRWVSNIERVGNTTSASVPLLLDHAHTEGGLRPGHRVVVAAFGAGLTWGATSLVWPRLHRG
ncbi:beta-ketoacyl-ACP synthase III [Streptomyces sp. NPDC048337]|uniref:beta-ketoacyl-ACP synthase III n=1 Tax=Streptomyces sp. NPDC048337 TaxID=3365535 RepID=UPI00371FF42D